MSTIIYSFTSEFFNAVIFIINNKNTLEIIFNELKDIQNYKIMNFIKNKSFIGHEDSLILLESISNQDLEIFFGIISFIILGKKKSLRVNIL